MRNLAVDPQVKHLPNFFIIGAAKAGTTSIYNYLQAHPGIFLSPVKEPQFFCHEDLFAKGMDYYLSTFFKGGEQFKARGEATPHYIYYEKVARRIAELFPKENQRFILIMRDPVDRAYSLYWNMVCEGHENLSFEEAIAVEQDRAEQSARDERTGTIRFQYYDSGLYAKQIRRYLKYFDKEQFLFLFHQDLKKDRDAVLRSIYEFLGVVTDVPVVDSKEYNVSGLPRSRAFHDLLRRPNWLKTQLGRIVPYGLKYKIVTGLLELNKKSMKYPSMPEGVEERLRQKFKDDVLDLEKVTNRDLSVWLPKDMQRNVMI